MLRTPQQKIYALKPSTHIFVPRGRDFPLLSAVVYVGFDDGVLGELWGRSLKA
jgi:hypothetical protein